MKTLKILPVLVLFLLSFTCYSQMYIEVRPRTDIPKGSKEFYIDAPIDSVVSALKKEGIIFFENSSGIETDEVLLNRNGVAKYKISKIGEQIRVIPFWKFTAKAVADIQLASGVKQQVPEFERIFYKDHQKMLPNIVFNYGVQVFEKTGKISYK